MAGKGDTRRPTAISPEEERIRWKLAYGKITFAEFERRYEELVKQGKTRRKF